MKTLSVRFYKRLILAVLALLILIPTVLAVRFGLQNAKLKKQLTEGAAPSGPTVSSGNSVALDAEEIDYQLLYPELYSAARVPVQRLRAEKTVYLTFDCSPNDNTERVLDILSEYGVKGTFFLSGSADPDTPALMKRVAQEGHAVGVGSYSNSYQGVYSSVSAYLDDFAQIFKAVEEATGTAPEIFRFPGGSVNAYNSGIYQELIAEMLRRGFVFFDWNASGEDSQTGELTAEAIRNNVLTNMEGKDRGIVQLRDAVGKEPVADALPGVIEELRDKGYRFEPLSAEVLPVVFSYKSAP